MQIGPFIAVAVGSFLSTNVDNLLTTTAQIAVAPVERVRRIVRGQYVGFTLVTGTAVAVAAAIFDIPTRWVGLLGFVPISLGLRGLLTLRRSEDRTHRSKWPMTAGFITSALITVASSGDNLAVYIPLLRASSLRNGAIAVAIFFGLDFVLCWTAQRLGRNPVTLKAVERAGAIVAPLFYLAIGVVVLARARTFSPLF